MIAIVLCAGFATRLYPLTQDFPKPLLQVGGRPVLDYLVDQLVAIPEMQAIHVATNARFYRHFLAWQSRRQEAPGSKPVQILVHDNGISEVEHRRGAIGDLALVVEKLPVLPPAVVAAGDNIFRFSLAPIARQCLVEKKNVVVALHEADVQKLRRTGVLQLDAAGDRVVQLQEKPAEPRSHWSCPALYFLQPAALARVVPFARRPACPDAPGHFIAELITVEPVFAARVEGSRLDIGSLEALEQADRVLLREPVRLTGK